VIPARGGSKGVPRKNIRLLGGKPLIAHTIESALACPIITDLVVSTDDPEIRSISLQCGAQVPFIRPAELATDTSLAVPTIQHAVQEMEKIQDGKYDYIIMLQPTAPLRTSEDLIKALTQLIESKADGIISIVHVDNWHPMKMKRFVENWLIDYEKPPMENPPRQILPPVYMVNGAIYATRRDVFIDRGSFQGDRCLGYIMPPERSVNIDNEIDFMIAEYMLNRTSGVHNG
jgi:CMP-N,N'-diacetyllegionaminic acid synthase